METGMQMSQTIVAHLKNVYTFMVVMDGPMIIVLLQKMTLFAKQVQVRRFMYLLLLVQEILVMLSVKLLATMV